MAEPSFMPEWAWNGAFVFVGALAGALASGAVAWFLEKKRLEGEAKRSGNASPPLLMRILNC